MTIVPGVLGRNLRNAMIMMTRAFPIISKDLEGYLDGINRPGGLK